MSDNASKPALNYTVTPRTLYLATEIDRQCDQVLAIIAETLADLSAHRAGIEAHNRSIRRRNCRNKLTITHSPPRAGWRITTARHPSLTPIDPLPQTQQP